MVEGEANEFPERLGSINSAAMSSGSEVIGARVGSEVSCRVSLWITMGPFRQIFIRTLQSLPFTPDITPVGPLMSQSKSTDES